MSIYSDVRMLILKRDYEELKDRIENFGWDEYHLNKFNGCRTEYFEYEGLEFVLCSWNYVKWDLATDELVQLIVEYLDMLKVNQIPHRYLCLSEVGSIDERKCHGKKDDNLIPLIEGSMWIRSEIAVPQWLYKYSI